MGELSGCEIEPNIATYILDNLVNIEEIIYGICPGAGGYDAIALLFY